MPRHYNRRHQPFNIDRLLIADDLSRALSVLKERNLSAFLESLRRRFYSRTVHISFSLDIGSLREPPEIPLELRLVDYDPQRHTDARWYSQKILKLPMLWVGVNPDGEVCYTEGLADHHDNDLIAKWFPRCPLPQPGELLIEGSYVPSQHRNKGVFTAALFRLVEMAAKPRASSSWPTVRPNWVIAGSSVMFPATTMHRSKPISRRALSPMKN